jgi:hypothetical protein
MGIAKRKESAHVFLSNTTGLGMRLPTIIGTLRLFLVVFQHRQLRPQFLNSQEFVPFLVALCEQRNSGMITIVCTVLRRLRLSRETLRIMNDGGLFKVFFWAASELNDDISLHAAFLLAQTVGRVTYVDGLVEFCDKIAEVAMSHRKIAKNACALASDLVKYENCMEVFESMGLVSFFESKLGDRLLSKAARRFLGEIDELED